MKTEPMDHQRTGLELLKKNPDYYALGCEQGTGKTWLALADAEQQFEEGRITGVLIIAPKGVHTNWIRREIPAHLSVPHEAEAYRSGGGKKRMARWKLLCQPAPNLLTLFAMNIDAINTKDGWAMAREFLNGHKALLILDESSRIKNPDANRTKRAMNLSRLAVSRRILSGTMLSNGPMDLFSQFEFLEPGLLGTTSYRAFVAEYAELLPQSHSLVLEIRARNRLANPQIIARDREGRPRFKNLEQLNRLMAPHMYRVRKEDCLDLPDKVYSQHYFELTPELRRTYDAMEEEQRYYHADGSVDVVTALASLSKLRQITSGFIMREGEPQLITDKNPRVVALKEVLEDIEWPVIIWAHFREELRMLEALMVELSRSCVSYHGGVNEADRESAVDRFQAGDAEVFLGQPQAGGIGLTLTRAKTVVYYSNDFSLENRLQSEDRAHRKGTKHNVLYVDIIASETKDEGVALALQRKEDVLRRVLGDR